MDGGSKDEIDKKLSKKNIKLKNIFENIKQKLLLKNCSCFNLEEE